MIGADIAGKLAERFAEASKEILGDNLTGVYLHGSAAMGCYLPEKSDLDLITVVREPLTDACRRAYLDMTAGLSETMPRQTGNEKHGGIEMSAVLAGVCKPFVWPTPFETHFSRGHLDWYRANPDDYVRKMRGTDTDLAAHFTVLRARGVCLAGPPIQEVFGEVPKACYLEALLDDVAGAREEIAGDTLYLTLNLARVLAFQAEGLVLSKREGGDWALRNLPERYHPLIRAALEDYGSACEGHYDLALAQEYADEMLRRIMPG
ncbi:MAG: DUF4111 domain-containing protein [Clostridia bacterium]|nr:DUF4111 domain-containing protein [Clostridia bacterium]